MSTPARDITKPEPRRRPKATGTPILVRLQTPDLEALDKWISRHGDPKPSRPEAMRRIMTEYLTEGGHMRTRRDLRPSKKAEAT